MESFPKEYGYYEMTAPLGSGKTTKYTRKLVKEGHRVCLVEPYIGLARQVADTLQWTVRARGITSEEAGNNLVITAGSLSKSIHDSHCYSNYFDLLDVFDFLCRLYYLSNNK